MKALGKYQLIEQIGVGGFGEVYKGFDPYIKRHVAVKTCSSNSEETRTRFFHEAEIAGNLHHKNITTVYDFGLQDELPYLIQEYLSGEDLDRKIKRRDFLPYPEKLFYLLQIARGLAYAHSKGVIHRDVKPANVRILEDGTAKIMDFGIAKLAQAETGLTQTGMTLGTAAYLAPEQIKGDAVDVRTDIFSFGVMAYELLTYERPFPGQQISAVLYALLHTEPKPIHEHWPAAPNDIVRLIDRCLSKTADGRFTDGGDLLRELEAIQRQGREERTGAFPLPALGSNDSAELGPGATNAPPAGYRDAPAYAGAQMTDAVEETPTRLDELEITLGTHAVPEPELSEPTTLLDPVPAPTAYGSASAGSGSSSGLPWMVIAILAAVAGVVGWWLGTGGFEGAGSETDPAPTTAEDVAPQEERGRAGAPATADGEGDEPAQQAADDEAAGANTETAAPAAPVRGTLVVRAPSWTRQMTVQVDGGPRRGLASDQSIAADAGRHTLVFTLDEDGYRATKTVRVDLAAGERRSVSPAIPQPGMVRIRSLPNKPRAFASIDGTAAEPTPLSRALEPGNHDLELRARGGTDTQPLRGTFEVVAGQEVIVTFDLEAGTLEVFTK